MAHGVSAQDTKFGRDVLNVVKKFLAEHPSEVIFMILSQEPCDGIICGQKATRSFEETAESYVTRPAYSNLFWRPSYTGGTCADYDQCIPRLGVLRGKVVMFQKGWSGASEDKTKVFGIKYRTSKSMFSQDKYLLTGDEKWKEIKKTLDKADNLNDQRIYENYLSAFGPPSTPKSIAKDMNVRAKNYMHECTPQKYRDQPRRCVGSVTNRVGWIMADFPGPDLIKTVISFNRWKPLNLSSEQYIISSWGGSKRKEYGSYLSFESNEAKTKGTVTVRKTSFGRWRFQRVPGEPDFYYITSTTAPLGGYYLSWDSTKEGYANATLESTDRVKWQIVRSGRPGYYKIVNKHGFPTHKYMDFSLTWNLRGTKDPTAAVKKNGTVEWYISREHKPKAIFGDFTVTQADKTAALEAVKQITGRVHWYVEKPNLSQARMQWFNYVNFKPDDPASWKPRTLTGTTTKEPSSGTYFYFLWLGMNPPKENYSEGPQWYVRQLDRIQQTVERLFQNTPVTWEDGQDVLKTLKAIRNRVRVHALRALSNTGHRLTDKVSIRIDGYRENPTSNERGLSGSVPRHADAFFWFTLALRGDPQRKNNVGWFVDRWDATYATVEQMFAHQGSNKNPGGARSGRRAGGRRR